MASFLRTSETDKHWHLVYIDPDANQFLTSEDRDHTHEVVLYTDPLTNEPRLSIGMAGERLHSHDPQTLQSVLPTKPPKTDDAEVLKEAINLFKHAVNIEELSREKAYESVLFFKGEQWTKQEKEELNRKSRAAQVYNYTQAFVDSLSGLARQNRLDPRAFPMEGSDDGIADIATIVLTWIAKRSNLPQQEIRVFEDEVVPGRGLFHIDITQRENPLGDVVIERFPWADGYFGAHHELDASDATHAHKAKWISFMDAQARFPHIKDKLDEQLANDEEPEAKANNPTFERLLMCDKELIDKAHRRLRIIEHEIKETRTAYFIAPANGGQATEVGHKVFQKAETIPGLNMMEFPKERIRIVVTVGSLLVKNYYPDRPYDGFSIVPVYAYKFDDNEWCGKVEAMKDAQREINKRGSQAIDIVNRMLGQAYVYDDETFNDDRDRDRFVQQGGKPGTVLKVADTGRPPVPLERPQFPVELLRLHQQNVDIMQAVTNIPPAMAGVGGTGYESGQALSQQRTSGMVGNERVFDNFILSKQTVFRKVFKLIQKYYSKERIARLVLSAASDPSRMEPAKIGQTEIPMQRAPDEDAELMQHIVRMLETSDLSEYDITIGEQPLSPTAREAQFRMWMEAQNHGFQVPPGMLMELSSLPNKGKWAREMQAMQQAQMQMEQQKFAAEMAKAGRVPVNSTGGQPK